MWLLSRDSLIDRQDRRTRCSEGVDGVMDGSVERVGEDPVGEVMRLEVAPDGFDVVELRRKFGRPLEGQPVCTGSQFGSREFGGVDWAIVCDRHH